MFLNCSQSLAARCAHPWNLLRPPGWWTGVLSIRSGGCWMCAVVAEVSSFWWTGRGMARRSAPGSLGPSLWTRRLLWIFTGGILTSLEDRRVAFLEGGILLGGGG